MLSRSNKEGLRELHGDLDFIYQQLQDSEHRYRILIETQNKRSYEVVCQWEDKEVLTTIAEQLGLLVVQDKREVTAITIRQCAGGHRLKPSPPVMQKVGAVCCDAEGRWPLEGVTMDELASFLEKRFRRPVVNLTSLEGSWSILLSEEAGKGSPRVNEKKPLDDTGLEIQWETVTIPVTVVKDKP